MEIEDSPSRMCRMCQIFCVIELRALVIIFVELGVVICYDLADVLADVLKTWSL